MNNLSLHEPPSPSETRLPSRDEPWLRGLIVVLLLVGATQYFVRGTLRAIQSSGDFSGPYAASRVFWRGENPYDTNLLRRELAATQVPGSTPYSHVASCLYPPQTFVLYSPFGFLQWQYARVLMAIVNSILPLLAVASLGRTGGQTEGSHPVIALLLVLFWAPLHTGIGLGQPSVVCVSLSLLALQMASSRRPVLAGCLLIVSAFAKIHDALPMVLYFVVRRWWKSLWVFGAIGVASVAGIGIWWGAKTEIMVQTVIANYRFEHERGLISPTGPMNWQRIDLAPLCPDLTLEAVILCTTIALVFVGLLAWKDRKGATDGPPTPVQAMSFACLSLLVLLAVYHRYYDAHVLLVPVLHGLQHLRWRSVPRWLPGVALLGLLPVLLPLSAILYTLRPGWRVPLHSSIAGLALMLHLNIVMLLAFVVTIWGLTRSLSRRDPNGASSRWLRTPDEMRSIPRDHLKNS